MDVGQIVADRAPSFDVLDRMSRLLADDGAIRRLARATHDPRMEPGQWHSTLHAELNLLTRWAARRFTEIPEHPQGVSNLSRVLSLLPSYGFALHILRRAAPFAVLGLPTTISTRPDLLEQARTFLHPIAAALGLVDMLVTSRELPSTLVKSFVSTDDLVVLTGKRDTFHALRRTYPSGRVLAATGHCLMVIGRDADSLNQVAAILVGKRLEPSCSNLGPALVFDNMAGLEAEAKSAHPTLILRVGKPDSDDRFATVGGYRIIDCDRHGIPDGLDGVARDPIGGWPGDYIL